MSHLRPAHSAVFFMSDSSLILLVIPYISFMKHIGIYILFAVSAILILINRYTELYINDYRIHFLFLFIAASTFVIIVGHLFGKLRSNKSIIITFLIVGIGCFLKAYFTWGGDWRTQTVLYQNLTEKNTTINYQLRAIRFQFGYKKRVVQIKHLAPFLEWNTDVDTLLIDKSQWKKVDINLNEMKLE